MLTATGTGDLQWMLNDVPIDGATNSDYTPTQDGSYTVSLYDVNGCYSVSEAFAFVGIGEFNRPFS